MTNVETASYMYQPDMKEGVRRRRIGSHSIPHGAHATGRARRGGLAPASVSGYKTRARGRPPRSPKREPREIVGSHRPHPSGGLLGTEAVHRDPLAHWHRELEGIAVQVCPGSRLTLEA
jgi:hypothetical protein